MQNAVAPAQCQAHMRGRMEAVSLARNHANDVAAAQFWLDAGDLVLWNFIERSRRYIRFHSRKRPEQRAIRSKITIMPPASGHFAGRMRHAASAKLTRHIANQAAAIIIVKPVFQVMQTGKIITRALAAAITVHLDVVE